MLLQLCRHFNEPVMPMGRYCIALRTWAQCVTDAHHEDVAAELHPLANQHGRSARFAHLVPFFRDLELAISKSALLARLLYDGEPVRTEKCPEHQGHWSGLEFGRNACPHGCQLTGWLPVSRPPSTGGEGGNDG